VNQENKKGEETWIAQENGRNIFLWSRERYAGKIYPFCDNGDCTRTVKKKGYNKKKDELLSK
jgi:hypothetical protein